MLLLIAVAPPFHVGPVVFQLRTSQGALALGLTAALLAAWLLNRWLPDGWTESRIARVSGLALGAIAAGLLLATALIRHSSFHSNAYDLGIFTQLFWNLTNGGGLEISVRGVRTALADHAAPTWWALSPLFQLWPDPRCLILIQWVALMSAGLPLWLLTRSWVMVVVYLLYPPLHWLGLFDVHEVALAVPLMLWVIWGWRTGKAGVFWGCALLLVGVKEELGIVAGMVGVVLGSLPRFLPPQPALRSSQTRSGEGEPDSAGALALAGSDSDLPLHASEREGGRGVDPPETGLPPHPPFPRGLVKGGAEPRWWGWGLAVLGFGWLLIYTLVVQPSVRGGEYYYLHRYAYLGDSMAEVARNFVTQPGLWVPRFLEPRPWLFLALLLAPLGFQPLKGWRWLVALVPTFVYSVLSVEALQTSIYAQYTAVWIPLLLVAMAPPQPGRSPGVWASSPTSGGSPPSPLSPDAHPPALPSTGESASSRPPEAHPPAPSPRSQTRSGEGEPEPSWSSADHSGGEQTPPLFESARSGGAGGGLGFALLACLFTGMVLSPLEYSRASMLPRLRVSPWDRAVAKWIAEGQVPRGAAISASSKYVPHLATRPEVWRFPVTGGWGKDAQYVLIDATEIRGEAEREAFGRVRRNYKLIQQAGPALLYAAEAYHPIEMLPAGSYPIGGWPWLRTGGAFALTLGEVPDPPPGMMGVIVFTDLSGHVRGAIPYDWGLPAVSLRRSQHYPFAGPYPPKGRVTAELIPDDWPLSIEEALLTLYPDRYTP